MATRLTPEQVDAWRNFITAHATVVENISKDLDEAGVIPLNWYDVLVELSLSSDKSLRMSDLAKAVVLSRSGITRLIDRLEQAGYLCRRSCSEDRRGLYAVITPEGEAALEKAWPVYADSIQRHFIQHIDPATLRKLSEALAKVLEAEG